MSSATVNTGNPVNTGKRGKRNGSTPNPAATDSQPANPVNAQPANPVNAQPANPVNAQDSQPVPSEPLNKGAVRLHTEATRYVNPSTLNPNPKNARLSSGEFQGIAVRSSFRVQEMADSILRDGDVLEPALACGQGCESAPGTLLKGHIRLGAWNALAKSGQLPETLAARGFPVEFRDGLTGAQESALLYDHNVSTPLSPTECFALLLQRQADGLSDMEIATRWPHLVAGYLGESVGSIPTDANERVAWYDKKRDTLAYNVLIFGRVPDELLKAKILLIQEQKEGAFTGKDSKPVYRPFKPTAQRSKALYSAYRKDRDNGQWRHKIGGPEFDKLCAEFIGQDFPTAPTEPVAVQSQPVPVDKIRDIRDFIGESVPFAGTLLTFLESGNRPDNYDSELKNAQFANALFAAIVANRAKFAKVLPGPIMSAIDQRDIAALTSTVATLPE